MLHFQERLPRPVGELLLASLSGLLLLAVTSPAFAQRPAERDRDREQPAPRERDDRFDRDRGPARDRQWSPERERTPDRAPERERDRSADRGAERLVQPHYLPPRPRGDRWKLGVYAVNTPTGVLIRRVAGHSAASRAGLEAGDVILTVDGYQVGYVGGQLYGLGDELQLRAGRQGEVRLLVQNHRNDHLVNVPVRLDRRDDFVRPRSATGEEAAEANAPDEAGSNAVQ